MCVCVCVRVGVYVCVYVCVCVCLKNCQIWRKLIYGWPLRLGFFNRSLSISHYVFYCFARVFIFMTRSIFQNEYSTLETIDMT